MSFALDFRKKLIKTERRKQARQAAIQKAEEGFAIPLARKSEDTSRNRRRTRAALLIAALILAVFNSGALVQYARGLSDTALGKSFIEVVEGWHKIMENRRVTAVSTSIQNAVTAIRTSGWRDIAGALGRDVDEPKPQDVARPKRPDGPTLISIPSRYGGAPAAPIKRAASGKSG